jgi:hypothetical protein
MKHTAIHRCVCLNHLCVQTQINSFNTRFHGCLLTLAISTACINFNCSVNKLSTVYVVEVSGFGAMWIRS